MSTGMIPHSPLPEQKNPARMTPPCGVLVGQNIGLFHVGGPRFICTTVYPEHHVGEWIVFAHGRFDKVQIARFLTQEAAETFVREREAEDLANRPQTCEIPPQGQINLGNVWWPMELPA